MCLKDASVPNISAISEKSNFPHIFADINDNCIRPMVIHLFHSFIMLTWSVETYVLMLNEYKNTNIQEIRYIRGMW